MHTRTHARTRESGVLRQPGTRLATRAAVLRLVSQKAMLLPGSTSHGL
jgi:hypothetical protein